MKLSWSLLLFAVTTAVHAVPPETRNNSPRPSPPYNPYPFSPGFSVQNVLTEAENVTSHSWEYGTLTQALLELYNPSYSVFGPKPFPVPSLDKTKIPSLTYADKVIVIGTGKDGLSDGDGAVGDPVSLGVSAVLLGKREEKYKEAARSSLEYVMGEAPRAWNGAISHRADHAELWADFIYMAPPFIAYYAADTKNASLLLQSVAQCRKYRQILQANNTSPPSVQGTWHHILNQSPSPGTNDFGLWATGNAWAAAGMTRVLATVLKSNHFHVPKRNEAVRELTGYIKEIVDGVLGAQLDEKNGLLRNYINDLSAEHGYGEASGSSLISAVIYRMVVLQPQVFGAPKYLKWAENVRKILGGKDVDGNVHITEEGIVTPTVNPLGWLDTVPYTKGSPEGQSFVVLLYSAWRDCVGAGKCKK